MVIERTVRFKAPRLHHWPKPSEGRHYLGNAHRHLFHIEVTIIDDRKAGRNIDDRSTEFHDILDDAREAFDLVIPQDSDMSCERMALTLAHELWQQYTEQLRVAVFEDGECGATVWYNGPRHEDG